MSLYVARYPDPSVEDERPSEGARLDWLATPVEDLPEWARPPENPEYRAAMPRSAIGWGIRAGGAPYYVVEDTLFRGGGRWTSLSPCTGVARARSFLRMASPDPGRMDTRFIARLCDGFAENGDALWAIVVHGETLGLSDDERVEAMAGLLPPYASGVLLDSLGR